MTVFSIQHCRSSPISTQFGHGISEYLQRDGGLVFIAPPCMCVVCQVVKLRVVAADGGRPPLSTTLNLSLVVNHTVNADDDDMLSSYDDSRATDGRRRGADGDPANVVLVGAACGSGLVMFTAILTGVVFALRSQHRRQHQRSTTECCCCCCCCDADNHGPSHHCSLASSLI